MNNMFFQNIIPDHSQIILQATSFWEEYLRVHRIVANLTVNQSSPPGISVGLSAPIGGISCKGKGILEHSQGKSVPTGLLEPTCDNF